MPRQRKIDQESSVEETPYVASYAEPENIMEAKMSVIESPLAEDQVFDDFVIDTSVKLPKQKFKIYKLGVFIEEAEEDSDDLNTILEKNKVQLYINIEKLKQLTNNQEDLALFNIPQSDNRVYNSLNQYYQQNGFAPSSPKISDWMTYYKIKYPVASDEEIAISVFGPLDYSFEII